MKVGQYQCLTKLFLRSFIHSLIVTPQNAQEGNKNISICMSYGDKSQRRPTCIENNKRAITKSYN